MTKNDEQKLKAELVKILYRKGSDEKKTKAMEALCKKFENVSIGIAQNLLGIIGIFVAEDEKPLFCITTEEFKQSLKEDKEKLSNEIDKILSNMGEKTEEMLQKEFDNLGKKLNATIDFKDNKVSVSADWLFWTEF